MENKYRQVKKYLSLLNELRWEKLFSVENIEMLVCDYKQGNELPVSQPFSNFENGGFWGGGYDKHAWFRFSIPPQGKNTYVRIKTDREGVSTVMPQFIAYLNGKTVQGLDTNHTELLLPENTPVEIYLYGYTSFFVEDTRLFVDVFKLHTEVDGLYYDIRYPFEALDFLDKESGEYAIVLERLSRAVNKLSLYDTKSECFFQSVCDSRAYLRKELYDGYCKEQNATTVCIGHTHIDCAWLWTLRQTREKVQRSFATVLELMKHYPEYRFTSSQALLYKYFKEENPELYEEMKERIREGRWEVEGSMWVEADCNLSSGESLVRQIVYGKRFFKEEFNVDNHILWLPDVFGYSAALPQILKKCGVDWFFTSKISWNDTNRMPYDTFSWKGIDGTEINSYFLTAQQDNGGASVRYADYVGSTGVKWISGAYKRFANKNLSNEVLLTYGWGDGGGGPTSEMLELLRRGNKGLPSVPNARIDCIDAFFNRLGKRIKNNPELPKWQGELYLEFHRGTYTTAAKNKRNNRKCEFLLENAETACVISKELCSIAYPQNDLRKAWEIVLTNQFHDIIPGSSIREVYEQSDADYAMVENVGSKTLYDSLANIASLIETQAGYLIYNPTSFAGEGIVQIDGRSVLVKGIVSKGYSIVKEFIDENNVCIEGCIVETGIYRVQFDENWRICSIFDKRYEREVLQKGAIGNELRVYEDYPDDFDAWEWQAYSRQKYQSLKNFERVEELVDGIRKGIRVVRRYHHSEIVQTVWFYDNFERIDFDTKVDWHERHVMLKAVFPVDINADKATYEIQFGAIERSTHFNTSWDKARFEVCGHKYADVSEGGYGVGLMNDCKYGHDIHDGIIQLSLLRGSTYPDTEADQGEHQFVYALSPHGGDFKNSNLIKTAYLLNNPMIAYKTNGLKTSIPLHFSTVSLNKDNVICETVKLAEDGSGVIMRLYESKNLRTKAIISTDLAVSEVHVCDMLENELYPLQGKNGTFSYLFNGFEILTLKLK